MDTTTTDLFGLVGQRLDGKYDIAAVVAEGGFGIVYRGTHVSLQKPIAVKVLKVPAELEGAGRKAFLERFAQEARLIAALDHPAIVRVLDFGASPMPVGEAAPWMVLEWLSGTPLDAELDARRGAGGQSPADCILTLRPVFEALAYAHDEGVAHRDIKPPNLMIVKNKRGERSTRVLDFGIAKVMGAEDASTTGRTATQSQQRAYSPDYATPEQISGTRTGPWTDVYALSLVLTEMLTDASPYDGGDLSELFVDVLSPRRPTPSKRGFDVGPWEEILARAVSIKPSERYSDARAFLAALEASMPTSVRAPTQPPPAPNLKPGTPDTLDCAKTIRDTTPSANESRKSRAKVIGITALAMLAVIVGMASFLIASKRETSRVQASPMQSAVPPASTAVLAAPTVSVAAPAVEQTNSPLAAPEPSLVDAGAPRPAPPATPRVARIAGRPLGVPRVVPTIDAAPSAPQQPHATPAIDGHEQVPTE